MSSSGAIETQDLFIKRMTGLTKLFASCLSSQAVGGLENESLDMASAWIWLVRVVNLKPRHCTTATVLSSFLSVCGSRLMRIYGRQAQKLLRFMLTQFLPIIRDVTDADSGDGGAMARLELCLTDLLNRRGPTDPEGYIKRSFWYSSE